MKHIYWFFIFIIALQGAAQYSISGQVHLADTTDPVIGATVLIKETGQGGITNKDGRYLLQDVKAGDYQIEISSVGLSTVYHDLSINQDVSDLTFSMNEKAFDLPQVVIESVTMTGGFAGIQNSLGSAHYIGQKEIQKFSYTDINRTLRNIPGVNIQEEDGYGLRPNIGLRATGSERSSKITVMEDGVLASPAPYAAPAAYYFPTVGRMEAIEIMKGSSQIKYGPYTTGGAINLISTPIPTDFSGHADLIAGSNGYRMLHANLGNAHKNVAYMVETMQFGADGFKTLDNGGDTGFNKEDYLAKIRVNTNPDAPIYQSLTFKIGQAKESSNETYLGLTDEDFASDPLRRYAGSAEDLMTTEQEQYTLTHFAALSDILDIHTTAYRNDFHRNWYKLDKVNGSSISGILSNPDAYTTEMSLLRGESTGDNALAVKANNRSYYAQGIQTNAILHFNTNNISHKIDIGLRLHKDELDRYQWVDSYDMDNGIMKLTEAGVPGTESNRLETATAFSSYVQYRLKFENWTLTPGIRYEDIQMSRIDYGKSDTERVGTDVSTRENHISIVIPGLAASYQITEEDKLFGGVHKGFAPPGSRAGTNPEESWNYEIGYRHNGAALTAQVTAYVNDYSNLLGADLAAAGGSGTQDLYNGGEAIAKGIEAELSYDLLSSPTSKVSLPLSLAYTFTETTFSNDFESEFEAWGDVVAGAFLPYVPRHQFSSTLSMEHERFLLDISGRYSTEMLTEAGFFSDQSVGRTDEAFTMDIALNYRLSRELSAFVNVNNVTDNVYIVSRRPAGVRPNLPRTFNVGLKANF